MKLQAIKNKLIVKLGGFTKQEVLQIAPPEIREPMEIVTLSASMTVNTSNLNIDRNVLAARMKEDVLYKLTDKELRSKVTFKTFDDYNNEITVTGAIKVVNRRIK